MVLAALGVDLHVMETLQALDHRARFCICTLLPWSIGQYTIHYPVIGQHVSHQINDLGGRAFYPQSGMVYETDLLCSK